MDIKELETRLAASQERLDKAIVLKGKYEAKVDKLQAQYNEALKTHNIEDNGYVAMNWSTIPAEVYNLNYDLGYAKEAVKDSERKIKELTQIRDNWKTKLELQRAKDNELATIPQIVKDFVHNWRVKTFDWIMKDVANAEADLTAARKLYDDAYAESKWSPDKEIYDAYCEAMRQYKQEYSDLTRHLVFNKDKEEELNKILDEEEKGKIFDLIKRVTKVTGTIIDASGLRIGEQNGELNGFVLGEEGKAYVETIGAGGYNIQRFHYRVLVKKVNK